MFKMDINPVGGHRPPGGSALKIKRAVAALVALLTLFGVSRAIDNEKGGPVIMYGDSRHGHDIHERVVDAFMTMAPVAVFNTGDLVTNSSSVSQWNRYNEIVSRIRAESEFYPVRGNHDGNLKRFVENAGTPGDSPWYSVDKNGIHFIVLDSISDIGAGSEQYMWLLSDLKKISDDTRPVVAIFHHPIFASEAGGHKADERGWGPILLPILEEHGVRLVFAGHVHAYERLKYKDIYFVTTGGGGAPLYARWKAGDYSEKYIKKHHFCRLSFSDNILKVDVFDIDLLPIDSFEIKY